VDPVPSSSKEQLLTVKLTPRKCIFALLTETASLVCFLFVFLRLCVCLYFYGGFVLENSSLGMNEREPSVPMTILEHSVVFLIFTAKVGAMSITTPALRWRRKNPSSSTVQVKVSNLSSCRLDKQDVWTIGGGNWNIFGD